jgi:Domain of unknown function (DUF4386)
MNTQPETRIEATSRHGSPPLIKPQRWARLYGGLYVINIVGSSFAFGYLDALVVPGDAAATTHNILANALLYRVSLVAHLIAVLTTIPGALLFYELFKVVNRRLALLDVFFGLVATAVEGANLLSQFTPLLLLGGGHATSAFTPAQVQALASLPFGSQAIAYDIQQVFYATDFLVVGYLLFRSTFVPRTVGVVLWIGALCYLTYSFADLLAPGFAAHLFPYIQVPSGLAELSLCLWFLVMGVNDARWEKLASQASELDRAVLQKES